MAFFRLLLVLAGFLFLRSLLRKKTSRPPKSPLGGGPPKAGDLTDETSPGAQSPQPIEDAEYEELR